MSVDKCLWSGYNNFQEYRSRGTCCDGGDYAAVLKTETCYGRIEGCSERQIFSVPPSRHSHPHQSKIGSEEPIFDSFSLEGEAFGGKLHLLQQNEPCSIRDKASPLGEKQS